MIRHYVLFKLKPEFSWEDPKVQSAEQIAATVGTEVPDLREWTYGRNVSPRKIAYDFVVTGLLDDLPAVERYLEHPFHQMAIQAWREISDWVIADVEE